MSGRDPVKKSIQALKARQKASSRVRRASRSTAEWVAHSAGTHDKNMKKLDAAEKKLKQVSRLSKSTRDKLKKVKAPKKVTLPSGQRRSMRFTDKTGGSKGATLRRLSSRLSKQEEDLKKKVDVVRRKSMRDAKKLMDHAERLQQQVADAQNKIKKKQREDKRRPKTVDRDL